MTYLSCYIGDSASLPIPLTWNGEAFEPGENYALIFTAKISDTDEDADAIIQKASGAGITVATSNATVALVPVDTIELAARTLKFDVQAQHVSTGEIRTVAYGVLTLKRDITRETQTSVPVNTTEEAVPFATPVTAAAIIAALNVPSYASLSVANANLNVGQIFWNSVAEELQIATA